MVDRIEFDRGQHNFVIIGGLVSFSEMVHWLNSYLAYYSIVVWIVDDE